MPLSPCGIVEPDLYWFQTFNMQCKGSKETNVTTSFQSTNGEKKCGHTKKEQQFKQWHFQHKAHLHVNLKLDKFRSRTRRFKQKSGDQGLKFWIKSRMLHNDIFLLRKIVTLLYNMHLNNSWDSNLILFQRFFFQMAVRHSQKSVFSGKVLNGFVHKLHINLSYWTVCIYIYEPGLAKKQVGKG